MVALRRWLFVPLLLFYGPVFAANDFSSDSNIKAVYPFESGALTTDSKAAETLTADNSPVSNTTTFKEGAGSVDMELDDGDGFHRTDANLADGFPLKSNDTTKVISIVGWVRMEAVPADGIGQAIVAKYNGSSNARSLAFLIRSSGGNSARLTAFLGFNSGTQVEIHTHATTLSSATWYHVTLTYDNSDKSLNLRARDTSCNLVGSDYAATATLDANKLSVVNQDFMIGFINAPGTSTFDGLLDEIVIANDVLTETESTQICNGTYPIGGTAANFHRNRIIQ